MVYNWDGKEAECYRLYVSEKKSLDEVIDYWEQRGFTPSKRAFQTQFKRWEFPSKQNPAHKNPALIARVKELWEKNYTQKEMLETLEAEGFSIIDRELMRLRLRYKWFLREARTGSKRALDDGSTKKAPKKKKAKVVPESGLINRLANAILQDDSSTNKGDEESEPEAEEVTVPVEVESPEQSIDPAEILRRQIRQEQMIAESDEKWRNKKRRRRTRGWAGLPADAPGEPPRFPSETTIDESKAYLSLDNNLYKQLREQFQVICQDNGVIKKTVAGPEVWAQLLQRLIRESPHLTDIFKNNPELVQQSDAMWKPKDYKSLSLDVICQDVTKRMRVMSSRMSLGEAKNALGLNPEQTRQVRSAFLAILKGDHFTNKFEAGAEHWNELKQQWIQESDCLHKILQTHDESQQQDSQKLRATEVLARDVMKRFRSEERGASQNPKQIHQGPGPGPGPAGPTIKPPRGRISSLKSKTTKSSSAADFEIDPSLLLAASDASLTHQPPTATHLQDSTRDIATLRQQIHPSFKNVTAPHAHSSAYAPTAQVSQTGPLPIYCRLHPLSSTPLPNKSVWLSILQTGTLAELKTLAMQEHPDTVVVRLEGLIMHGDAGAEREMTIPIDDNAELTAFLGHVGGGKATFMVLLSASGSDGLI